MPQTDKRTSLWSEQDCGPWYEALNSYPQAIEAQENERLKNLDLWYREQLPSLIASREPPYILAEELQGVAAWKMTRGVWRERNRHLIMSNTPQQVEEVSRRAFQEVPDLRKPVQTLSTLAGVGAATASAILAAYAPNTYPFFDEVVAAQIPGLGPVAFTAKYYFEYAEQLRNRAEELRNACPHIEWAAQDVSQALWAAAFA